MYTQTLTKIRAWLSGKHLGVKIIAVVIAIVMLQTIAVGWYTISTEKRLIVKQYNAQGNAIVSAIAPTVMEALILKDYPVLETITENIAQNNENLVFVSIKRQDGMEVAKSLGSMGLQDIPKEEILLYKKPVNVGLGAESNTHIGEVIIAIYSQEKRTLLRERIQSSSIAFLLYSLILGVTLSYLIKRMVVNRIVALRNQADQLGKGSFDRRITYCGKDEVSDLGNTLETMRLNISEAYISIKNQRDNLNTILHASQEGMVVTDQNNIIVLVNHAAEELLGSTKDAITEAGYFALFESSKNTERFLHSHLNDNQSITFNHHGKILSVNSATIENADKETIGSATLIRDVTQEKLHEQQLRQIAIIDSLTGLHNRRYLDQKLPSLFRRSQQNNLIPLGLILLDIDHFKRVNDTYGHDHGDQVLRAIGEIIRDCIRPTDIACRHGGEEFAIILPGAKLDVAYTAAERLRTLVCKAPIAELDITISLGVVSYPESTVKRSEDLMIEADTALYEAKNRGRNQVFANHVTASHTKKLVNT